MGIDSEKGNVLFLILIAVVLFAALSFAFTQNTRPGIATPNSEVLEIQASEIVQYATYIENTIMRMIISQKCSPEDISFYMPGIAKLATYKHTPESPDTCKVFHPLGGGANYHLIPTEFLDETYTGVGGFNTTIFANRTCVEDVPEPEASACNSDGIDNEDLVMIIPFLKSKALCSKINARLGVMPYNADPPYDANCGFIWNATFDGNYSDGYEIDSAGGELKNQRSGCFAGNAVCPETYTFYHVLIAR